MTEAGHVGRVDHLQMREPVMRGRHPVGSARCLDGIDGRAYRRVADRVDVEIESGRMCAPGVLENYLARMLQLTVGDGALRRVIAIRLDECLDRARRRELPRL